MKRKRRFQVDRPMKTEYLKLICFIHLQSFFCFFSPHLFFLLPLKYTMATYYTVPEDEQQVSSPTFKPRKSSSSVLASVMLSICIICFVIQTELAQYVQKNTDYSKPYFIL
jgi:hypothetical protein